MKLDELDATLVAAGDYVFSCGAMPANMHEQSLAAGGRLINHQDRQRYRRESSVSSARRKVHKVAVAHAFTARPKWMEAAGLLEEDWPYSAGSAKHRNPYALLFPGIEEAMRYRVAIGYAVAAWLTVQIAATVLPAYRAPDWVLPAFITLVAVGFPVALMLAWAFDVTPSRHTHRSGRCLVRPQIRRRTVADFVLPHGNHRDTFAS